MNRRIAVNSFGCLSIYYVGLMDSSTYLPYNFKLVTTFGIWLFYWVYLYFPNCHGTATWKTDLHSTEMLRFNFPLQHPPSLTTFPYDRKVNMNSYLILFLMNLKFDTNINILMSHKVYIFNFISVFEIISKMPHIVFNYLRNKEFCIKSLPSLSHLLAFWKTT